MESHADDPDCSWLCGPFYPYMYYKEASPFYVCDATEENGWAVLTVRFGQSAFVTDPDIRIKSNSNCITSINKYID